MLSRMGLVRKLGNDHFVDEVPDALLYVQQVFDKRSHQRDQEQTEDASPQVSPGPDGDELKKAHSQGRAAPVGGNQPAKSVDTSQAKTVPATGRSEEHTSELQSRGHLVCRLLLEKKKRSHMETH